MKPIIEQYEELQNQHPENIVALRVGDFYMFYGENARKATDVLMLTLTVRHKPNGQPVPMCGFPYHQADSYCAKYHQRTGKPIVLSDSRKE